MCGPVRPWAFQPVGQAPISALGQPFRSHGAPPGVAAQTLKPPAVGCGDGGLFLAGMEAEAGHIGR
jgi:hypothetical protein